MAQRRPTWQNSATPVMTVVCDPLSVGTWLLSGPEQSWQTVAGPAAWNSLPAEIRSVTSRTAFLHQFKTHCWTRKRVPNGYECCGSCCY